MELGFSLFTRFCVFFLDCFHVERKRCVFSLYFIRCHSTIKSSFYLHNWRKSRILSKRIHSNGRKMMKNHWWLVLFTINSMKRNVKTLNFYHKQEKTLISRLPYNTFLLCVTESISFSHFFSFFENVVQSLGICKLVVSHASWIFSS